MNDHLRAVADSPEASHAQTTGGPPVGPPVESTAPRMARRMRPSKPLPTDRMKMDTQTQALAAIAVASASRENGVTAADIAARIGVVEATAGLNNAFFAAAGWIERVGKGLFKPSDAAIKYAQRLGFNETEAAALLAPAIRESWYFREIEPELRLGRPVPVARMVSILAQAAGAGVEYRPQLEGVLAWLQYVGVIVITDGHVQLGQRDLQDLGNSEDEAEKLDENLADPAGGEGSEPTTKKRLAQANAVISLDFDLSLTAEDLAKLEPERITALFEAVGRVAAIKAAMT